MPKAESKEKSSHKKTKSAAKKPVSKPIKVEASQLEQLRQEIELIKGQLEEKNDLYNKTKAELDEKSDLYVRVLAELDNTRKRASRDVEQAHKFALDRFAADLLGVSDSLELGLKAAEAADTGADTLRGGMDMTLKQLKQIMEKFGITELVPKGEAFNTEFHEAIAMQPSDEQAPNTVLEVVQKGFVLNGRVLRAARVVVAIAPDRAGTA